MHFRQYKCKPTENVTKKPSITFEVVYKKNRKAETQWIERTKY